MRQIRNSFNSFLAIPFTLIVVTSACSEALVACDGPGTAPITVIVHDSTTGAPAAVGSRLILHYGSRVDTTLGVAVDGEPRFDSVITGGLSDTPGAYAVKVEHEGYRDWTKENVIVQRGGGRCGALTVETVTLQVRLQPLTN